MKIPEWDGERIIIRPSSIDSFSNCAYQWYHTFIGKEVTIPAARAAMGTAIHAAAEHGWNQSIKKKAKVFNLSELTDLAIEEFQELDKQGLQYDNGDTKDSAESAIIKGTTAFVEDIVPYTKIPLAVERRFEIHLDHPVVEQVGGTVDYISDEAIADIKTSKRKPVPASYKTQQSTYKMLAAANGYDVKHTYIQGVVLKQNPEGMVLELESNVDQAKHIINNLLETLEVMAEGKVAPEVLFRGNPKYYLCDPRYCAKYATCPFVNG